MTFSLEDHEGGRIVWLTVDDGWQLIENAGAIRDAIVTHVEEKRSASILVADARQVRAGFGPLVGVLVQADSHSRRTPSKLREAVLVTAPERIDMAARALQNKRAGEVITAVFDDPDAAYTYAQSKLNRAAV